MAHRPNHIDASELPPDDERPPRQVALLWAVAFSALFMVVYGGTNWITSQRSDVGTFYFEVTP